MPALSSTAWAADPAPAKSGSGASGELSLSTSEGAEASGASTGEKPRRDKWIHRWAPENNMGELGIYGGIMLPSRQLELFQPDLMLPDQGFKQLRPVAPDLGIRGGYYPLRFVGVELEAGVMPTKVNNAADKATLYTVRGHVVGQLGLWSVTPFVLLGAGGLGVSSPRAGVGKDIDAAIHFGIGAKFYINRYIMLRLDLRDVLTARRGVAESVTQTFEVLLGLSVTLGRKKDRSPPKDLKDTDGDGFLDHADTCPSVPGVAPDGCPLKDRDGDGFLDADDKCPDQPGTAPDGCPRPDRDQDRIADVDDKCPDDPENRNGFRDADGCPDEVPKEVRNFTGVIEGINFDVDKDTIKRESRPRLDNAAELLKQFGELSVEIGGHTDATGSREHNLDLSQRRAESVKKYLVERGVDEKRLTTRGYGPDKPIATNDTKEGRTKNRRIEFSLTPK